MQPKREREADAIVIGRQHEGGKAECIESLPEGYFSHTADFIGNFGNFHQTTKVVDSLFG